MTMKDSTNEISTIIKELFNNLDDLYKKVEDYLAINKKNSFESIKGNIVRIQVMTENLSNYKSHEKFIAVLKNDFKYYGNKISELNYIYQNTPPSDNINEITGLIDNLYQMSLTNMRFLDSYLSTIENLTNNIKNIESSLNKKIEDYNGIFTLNKNEEKKLIETIKKREQYIEKTNQLVSEKIEKISELESSKTLVEQALSEATSDIHAHKENIEKLVEKVISLENQPISKIYNDASKKYRKYEKNYRNLFFIFIAILLLIFSLLIYFKSSIILSLNSKPNNYSLIEFWIIKTTIILVGITLISYFLKQSSHYQKLADQSHQTQIELEAYPNFMNSVPPEQAIDIRKELALKYFGREIDGSTHKDMSNLISDQMKNTTEMVKATTDVIKNLKTPN